MISYLYGIKKAKKSSTTSPDTYFRYDNRSRYLCFTEVLTSRKPLVFR